MSSVTLSQDNASVLPGINLKWVYASLGAIKEISLIFFKNVGDADIASVDIPSGVLRYNLPSGFQSGQAYSFQLQVVDVNDVMVYSNTLVLTSPYFLVAPVIASCVGFDSALQLQLQATSNSLSASDTVEFVLKRSSDNTVFWIIKTYASNGQYMLSDADDARLVNNVSYRVACMFQPGSANAQYKSPSPISNSFTATPSNLPNAPQNVTSSSVGTTSLDIRAQWARPSDFSEWSADGFSIVARLEASNTSVLTQTLTQDVLEYTWTDLAPGLSYRASIQYVNQFGSGPTVNAQQGFITPTEVADAPVFSSASDDDLQSVLTWQAPSYDGQSAITGYKVYKDGNLIASLGADVFTYTATGLMNGYAYSFYVKAQNPIGLSGASSSLQANPYGAMTIDSVVASGKVLTATISPNGRSIQSVVMVALDADPNDIQDQDFVITFTQQQINQAKTGTIQVIKNFSTFSSDIDFYCVIAHNASNSAFLKSA
jgi:hypothetical protein